jgi:EmrB/QacA subfamily drug resistance transporter
MGSVASNGSRTPRGARASPDWAVLALVCLGQFMVILDVSVVNVALPSIRTELGFNATGLQWVVNAYTLTFAGFMLLGGRAADIYGRRRTFMLGLGLFTVASLAGGLAQDRSMLVAARAAQGLGGAILAPATLTILTTHFREARARARALGIWSAVAAGGGAAGALLGGLLTEVSWRWVLFVNIPIGVFGLIAARMVLTESRDEAGSRSLDVAGAVTVTAALVTFVYGIVRTEGASWSSPATIGTFALAAILFGAFLVIETKIARSPLVPLGLFRSRSVTGANIVIFLLAAAMFSMWYFLTLYLQTVLGYSPLQAGLAFVPQTLTIVVGAQISSRLVTRIGPRPLLVVAPLIAAVGMLWLSTITPDSTFVPDILWPGVLITFGLGLAFTPVTFAATAGVPVEQGGLASGLVNTMRQVGGSIGLAGLATLAADRTLSGLAGGAPAPSALTAGFARAFAIGGAFLVVSAATAMIVPAKPRRARADREAVVERPAAARPMAE